VEIFLLCPTLLLVRMRNFRVRLREIFFVIYRENVDYFQYFYLGSSASGQFGFCKLSHETSITEIMTSCQQITPNM